MNTTTIILPSTTTATATTATSTASTVCTTAVPLRLLQLLILVVTRLAFQIGKNVEKNYQYEYYTAGPHNAAGAAGVGSLSELHCKELYTVVHDTCAASWHSHCCTSCTLFVYASSIRIRHWFCRYVYDVHYHPGRKYKDHFYIVINTKRSLLFRPEGQFPNGLFPGTTYY